MRFFPTNPLGFRVETEELADDSVSTVKIQNNAVTTGKIAMNTILEADISNNIITPALMEHQNQGELITYTSGSGMPSPLAVGTSGQVLTSNGAASNITWENAVVLKEISANVATWTTQFSTLSTSYVDVTNATVTLSGLNASKTYTLMAFANIQIHHQNTASIATSKLLIDGSDASELPARDSSNITTFSGGSMSGAKLSVTGSTSYIAKIQLQTNNASFAAICNTLSLLHSIVLMAVEE